MKKFSKNLCVVTSLVAMLGSIVMPVYASDTVIGEAISNQSNVVSESAILPEDFGENIPNQFTGISRETIQMNEYEWSVLYMTNKIRMANGISPLSVSSKLQNAANIRKNELTQKMDHTRPNGSDCFTALNECGVPYETAGENIAGGQMSPVDAINSWWNSSGHRSNMLGSQFTHMAAGYLYNQGSPWKHNWVQMFTGTCKPEQISLDLNSQGPYIITTNQSIDEMGINLKIKCPHGIYYMPVIEQMCSEIDKSLIGKDQTITISYGGKNTTIVLRVFEPMPFADVSPNSWYYDAVAGVYYNGIMTGLNNSKFGPADNLARAQFATILYRLNQEPQIPYMPIFPDVAEGEWYTEAVLWANKVGVVNGYSNTGKFGPADNINREQMAVMMYRYAQFLGKDTSESADYGRFSDGTAVNEFAKQAMSWAVGTGIISGKDNGTRLDPQGNANRAECATIIMRFLEHYNL